MKYLSEAVTREQWLLKATSLLQSDVFKQHGSIPKVRVSVGFTGSRKTALGVYWRSDSVNDKIPQIFISPILDDRIECLETLVHELVHACTPGDGHGKHFRKLALKVGLTGKMKETVAGPDLKTRLEKLSEKLGPFDQSKINLQDRKKQTTRMIKLECLECGYIARTSRKCLEEKGLLICPCNHEEMQVK